jgi:hypothetical protein
MTTSFQTAGLKDVAEGIAGVAAIISSVLTPMRRRWRSEWGATLGAVMCPLPGDDLVPQPKWGYTHAITIHAPTFKVWPWIVQIGQGRGGLYSYEWLENLAGCNIRNADRILPEFQTLKVSDGIRLHPQMPALTVAAVEPEHFLLLHGAPPVPLNNEEPAHFLHSSWLFFLTPHGKGTRTRLITRFRTDYGTSLTDRLVSGPLFTEPIGFVMERKMLLSIKERAEAKA